MYSDSVVWNIYFKLNVKELKWVFIATSIFYLWYYTYLINPTTKILFNIVEIVKIALKWVP